MATKAAARPLASETAWLERVQEVRHPIDPHHPLRVGTQRIAKGRDLPRPTVPYPERHPYCEVNFAIQGRGDLFIGMEKVERNAGDIVLIGPGIPHYGVVFSYPVDVIVVHFLPILLFEMSPIDGAAILGRFTGSRLAAQRVVRPPKALREKFAGQFEAMAEEFAAPQFGSDLSMRMRLMDVLVRLIQWEKSVDRADSPPSASSDWPQVEKILHFIYFHYAEPIYIEQIAREVGLSTIGLHRLFREAFGMSCIQYLTAYRISHAASLLCQPGARVIEIAPAVGFETLSHFNSAFRRFQGMSPREYIQSHKNVE